MYTKKSRELSQNGKQTPCLSFYVIFSASLFILTFLGLLESQQFRGRQDLVWSCLVPVLLQALEDLLQALLVRLSPGFLLPDPEAHLWKEPLSHQKEWFLLEGSFPPEDFLLVPEPIRRKYFSLRQVRVPYT